MVDLSGAKVVVKIVTAALVAGFVTMGSYAVLAQEAPFYSGYGHYDDDAALQEHRSSGIGPTTSGCGGAVGQTCATQTGVNSLAGSGGVAGGMGR